MRILEQPAGLRRVAGGIALIGALVLGGCGGEQPAATSTPPAIAVESGGMALTGSATPAAPGSNSTVTQSSSEATSPASATTQVAEATAPSAGAATIEPAAPSILLAAGAEVAAVGKVRLYADPDPAAQRLAQYPADARFVVVEPSGEYTAYPVENGGVGWYRLRAADGLVGWAMADAIRAQ